MKKIFVAKIGKTVGLKGFSKLFIESDFPEQFQKNAKFYTHKNQQLTVESYNTNSNSVKFFGIDSVEDAKKLTNTTLFTTIEDTKQNCNLASKEYFWFDLIDCEVIENNESLGVVEDIQRLPLSDYMFVKTSKQLIDQKFATSFLIPYLDQYIIDVDINNKKIKVQNAKDILKAS